MKTLLVVDDDKLLCDGLSAVLRRAGHNVLQADNGQAGLDAYLQNKPDLVVTDIHMPVMDGLQMLSQIRADDDGAQVPAIILSNDDSAETLNGALEAGVTVYLSKNSLDPAELVSQVEIALGNQPVS